MRARWGSPALLAAALGVAGLALVSSCGSETTASTASEPTEPEWSVSAEVEVTEPPLVRLTYPVGIQRHDDGRVSVRLLPCAQTRVVGFSIGGFELETESDEWLTMLWGLDSDAGVYVEEITVGDAPAGFNEEPALAEPLPADELLGLNVTYDPGPLGADSAGGGGGGAFTIADLPTGDEVLVDGEVMTLDEFRALGTDEVCSSGLPG
jgi:hypothetical protein